MWLLLTIVLSACAYAWEFYLDVRQHKKLMGARLPDNLVEHINPGAFKRMRRYSMQRLSFSRLESTYGFFAEMATMSSQILVWVWEHTSLFLAEAFDVGDDWKVFRGVSFLLVVSLSCAVMKAPFDLYRIVVIDGQLQRNAKNMVWKWFMDQVKMFLFSVTIGVPLISVALFMLHLGGTLHWLMVAAFLTIVSVVLSDSYPSFIAPFFNKFVPAKDKELCRRLKELSQRMGIPIRDILLMDGSKRSNYSNTFLIGSGNNRSIVLYDTLLQRLTNDEIVAIVASELAHAKYNHQLKENVVQILSIAVFLLIFNWIQKSDSFMASFGFKDKDPATALVLFGYAYGPMGSIVNTISNSISRSFTYTADAFAVSQGYDVETAVIKLQVVNVQDVVMDKLYSRYHNPYPSLLERLEAIQSHSMESRKEKAD